MILPPQRTPDVGVRRGGLVPVRVLHQDTRPRVWVISVFPDPEACVWSLAYLARETLEEDWIITRYLGFSDRGGMRGRRLVEQLENSQITLWELLRGSPVLVRRGHDGSTSAWSVTEEEIAELLPGPGVHLGDVSPAEPPATSQG